MSRYFLGVDLGSTTTKAVLTDESGRPLGMGLTDTGRSYESAVQGARLLAEIDLRSRLAAPDGPIEIASMVGTGYGRQRLPFPEERIRSEILCHGLGAHALFPGTRTVIDIGGQDTKVIQLDEAGRVLSFQMNDRCAAGCGRYLGYVAEEMQLPISELGPLALRATRPVRISSTCTVFAGLEIRDLLAAGESRENILAGLHRAIVSRALGLVARAGGAKAEVTFSGGVARNPAAVAMLGEGLAKSWGIAGIHVHADSIFTGALGAALFAAREAGTC